MGKGEIFISDTPGRETKVGVIKKKNVWTILKSQQDLLLLWNKISKLGQSPFWLFQTLPNYPREFKSHHQCKKLREHNWEETLQQHTEPYFWVWAAAKERANALSWGRNQITSNPYCSIPQLLGAVLHSVQPSPLGQGRAPCQCTASNSSRCTDTWTSLLHLMAMAWLV